MPQEEYHFDGFQPHHSRSNLAKQRRQQQEQQFKQAVEKAMEARLKAAGLELPKPELVETPSKPKAAKREGGHRKCQACNKLHDSDTLKLCRDRNCRGLLHPPPAEGKPKAAPVKEEEVKAPWTCFAGECFHRNANTRLTHCENCCANRKMP